MQKQAPTFSRLAVMVGFALSCFGLLLFLWLAFGGSVPFKAQGYRFTASFDEATNLAKEADVRISGVPVGKVKTITPDHDGRSHVVIELARKYAPVKSDAHAILRQKSLLGETYIELTPGSPRTPNVKEGGALAAAQVSPTVQLDEIFRAFDKPTRDAFQRWMQSQSQAIKGRGIDVNDAFGNLAPFAQDTNRLLEIIFGQAFTVRSLVSNTGEVFAALTQRDGQLRDLINNSNRVFETTARRDKELAATFVALPTFQREARATVNRLTRFAANTNPLLTNQLRPAARELSPTLVDLAALAPDLKGLFRELNPLIRASLPGLPALRKIVDDLRPALGAVDPTLRELNPILDYLGLYKPELQTFFSNTVAATQATDRPPKASGPVHYLRTTNPLNPEIFAGYPTRLGTSRPNPYQRPGAFAKLAQGLFVYNDTHCGAGGIPVLGPALSGLLPAGFSDLLAKFVFGKGTAPGVVPIAPPCKKQPKISFGGVTTDYPHVTQAPPVPRP